VFPYDRCDRGFVLSFMSFCEVYTGIFRVYPSSYFYLFFTIIMKVLFSARKIQKKNTKVLDKLRLFIECFCKRCILLISIIILHIYSKLTLSITKALNLINTTDQTKLLSITSREHVSENLLQSVLFYSSIICFQNCIILNIKYCVDITRPLLEGHSFFYIPSSLLCDADVK
jgi:hypothetical protein